MADNEETKNEDENNNTFGKFDNRFTRGAFAAVIAAYVLLKRWMSMRKQTKHED